MTPFAILIKAVTLWSSGEGCMSWTLSVLLLLQQRPLAAKRHLARIHMAFKTICHKFLIEQKPNFHQLKRWKASMNILWKRPENWWWKSYFADDAFWSRKTTKTSLKTVTHVKQHHKNVPTFFWGGSTGTNATNFAMLKTDLFATFSDITIGYIKGPITVQDFRIEY